MKTARAESEGDITDVSVPGVSSPQRTPRPRPAKDQPDVVPLTDMTSGQLIRRAKIIEEVIDLIAEVGADAVQMRDVAQRSGVALGTMYRYFHSKDHLLAAALEEWQKRLARRILSSADRAGRDPLPGLLDYLRRAQRAFNRSPEMTALMMKMMTSADPEAKVTLDHMNKTNIEMFDRLLDGIAAEDIPNVSFGVNAALSSALSGMLMDRLTLDEALDRVAWVARALVNGATMTSRA